jgi:hypothetical protein
VAKRRENLQKQALPPAVHAQKAAADLLLTSLRRPRPLPGHQTLCKKIARSLT